MIYVYYVFKYVYVEKREEMHIDTYTIYESK